MSHAALAGPGTGRKLGAVEVGRVVYYMFSCPACRCQHCFTVRHDGGHPTWRFDGDMARPTFTPALRNQLRGCYLFLEAGVIRYLPTCLHEYRNLRVTLPDLNED